MLTTREVILVKPEVTYNTDPVPTAAANSVLCAEVSWANEGLRMIDRPAVKPTFDMLKKIYGGRLMTLSIKCEIKGSGTAGTAPEIDPLLRASGLGVTNVPVTSDTYAPVSTGFESCTIYYYQDGTLFKLTGCRGNVSFDLEAGATGMANFTMTGHVSALTDAALVSPTFDSTVPPAVLGSTFTVDAFAAVISKLSFDMGNEVSKPPSVAAADGYGEIQIVGRDVNGSFDPEHELVATEDFIGNFISGAAMALSIGVIGSAAGNRYTITQPAISYRDVSPGDREKIRTLELPYGAAGVSGDDEIALLFN